MANRVVLSSTGLKVSKPGFNVLTAGDKDLTFNSDWGSFPTFAKMNINITAGVLHTVNYGKTFANNPILVWSILHGMSTTLPERVQRVGTGQHYLPYDGINDPWRFALTVYNNRFTYNAAGGSYLHNTELMVVIWDRVVG